MHEVKDQNAWNDERVFYFIFFVNAQHTTKKWLRGYCVNGRSYQHTLITWTCLYYRVLNCVH